MSQFKAVFPFQAIVEFFPQSMKVQDVRSGILQLMGGQPFSTPVARLHLLGDIDAEDFLAELLESVLVGVGPDQSRGDLRAINRFHDRVEPGHQRNQIESCVMKDFQDFRIFQHPDQILRIALLRSELNQVCVPVACAQLNKAKPVAKRIETHGLRVDSNHRAKIEVIRYVILIEEVCHFVPGTVDEISRKSVSRLGQGQASRSASDRMWLVFLPKNFWCPGEDSNFHGVAPTGT